MSKTVDRKLGQFPNNSTLFETLSRLVLWVAKFTLHAFKRAIADRVSSVLASEDND
jgi:hypothetical protein